MPTKTVYLKEKDVPLWEEARKTFGQSLSSIVASELRKRVGTGTPSNRSSSGRTAKPYALQGVRAENAYDIARDFEQEILFQAGTLSDSEEKRHDWFPRQTAADSPSGAEPEELDI